MLIRNTFYWKCAYPPQMESMQCVVTHSEVYAVCEKETNMLQRCKRVQQVEEGIYDER